MGTVAACSHSDVDTQGSNGLLDPNCPESSRQDGGSPICPTILLHMDSDGDGAGGDKTAIVQLCTSAIPPGYSASDADCNDLDPSVSHWAYLDRDGDHFGTNQARICSGNQPPPYKDSRSRTLASRFVFCRLFGTKQGDGLADAPHNYANGLGACDDKSVWIVCIVAV